MQKKETVKAEPVAHVPAKVEQPDDSIMMIRPVVDLTKAKDAFNQYEKIKAEVLTAKDISIIQGKSYVNKSGYRKIKTMFGFSEKILDSRREVDVDNTVRWTYHVKVGRVLANGQELYAEAMACCDTKEAFSRGKPENAIMAMAQTRAFNRAISDLVGGSGEKTGYTNTPAGSPQPVNCSICSDTLTQAVLDFSRKNFGTPLCMKCQEEEKKIKAKTAKPAIVDTQATEVHDFESDIEQAV